MKKLLSSLLVITFALFFVGCSSTVSTDSYTQGSAWIEVQEITYFINNDNDYGNTSYVSYAYTIKKTEEKTVKIRFLQDNSLEIMTIETRKSGQADEEYTQIIRILPLSYKVTYLPN